LGLSFPGEGKWSWQFWRSREQPGWIGIGSAIFFNDEKLVLRRCTKALHIRPVLPETAVDYLIHTARESALYSPGDHEKALNILESCENLSVLQCYINEWLCPESKAPLASFERIEKFLIQTRLRSAELIRAHVSDDDENARMRALKMLGKIGNLDDIGLLQDLLKLPELQENEPEREACVEAMLTIAGMEIDS
jgi:hypothetical protein